MIDGHLGSGSHTPENTSVRESGRTALHPKLGEHAIKATGTLAKRAIRAGMAPIGLVKDRRSTARASFDIGCDADDEHGKQAEKHDAASAASSGPPSTLSRWGLTTVRWANGKVLTSWGPREIS